MFGNVTEYSTGSAQSCCPLEVLAEPQLHTAVQTQAADDKFLHRLTLAAIALPFLLACICPIFVACVIYLLRNWEIGENSEDLREFSETQKKTTRDVRRKPSRKLCKENTKSCLNAIRELRIPWNANGRPRLVNSSRRGLCFNIL